LFLLQFGAEALCYSAATTTSITLCFSVSRPSITGIVQTSQRVSVSTFNTSSQSFATTFTDYYSAEMLLTIARRTATEKSNQLTLTCQTTPAKSTSIPTAAERQTWLSVTSTAPRST